MNVEVRLTFSVVRPERAHVEGQRSDSEHGKGCQQRAAHQRGGAEAAAARAAAARPRVPPARESVFTLLTTNYN